MNPYFTTPNIIKETANGTTYCPIQDEMFSVRRCVEVVGEITRDSVYSLILQLRYLCHAGQEKEITMYINSPGGSVCDGLALYDVMKGTSRTGISSTFPLSILFPLRLTGKRAGASPSQTRYSTSGRRMKIPCINVRRKTHGGCTPQACSLWRMSSGK